MYYWIRVWTLLLCLGTGQIWAQSVNHNITPLERDEASIRMIRKINGQATKQFYRTGNFTLELTSLGKAPVSKEPVDPERRYPGEVLHVHGETSLNPVRDSRNLPLSKNGRLLTPEGLEVEFVLPTKPHNPHHPSK